MNFQFESKKFREPLDTAVFTTTFVMQEHALITLITHELDGDWQFFGDVAFENYYDIAMVVSLAEIIKMDKSVLKVADLPLGYQATRNSKSDAWLIEQIIYSEEEIAEMGFYCAHCGAFHNEIPMVYEADAPYQYFQIPDKELEARCELNQNFCVIDSKDFFHKGQIQMRVAGKEERFAWNVWVCIKEEDFLKAHELLLEENRVLQPPYCGRLATKLACYPDTLDLEVLVYPQEAGVIPTVELQETNHPLFLEQESGITRKRVIEYARTLVYQHT